MTTIEVILPGIGEVLIIAEPLPPDPSVGIFSMEWEIHSALVMGAQMDTPSNGELLDDEQLAQHLNYIIARLDNALADSCIP